MPTYNKLVRDLIPEMIQNNGKTANFRILNEDEYIVELNKKMHEELSEYETATTTMNIAEELSDLLELIHAAADYYGLSAADIEKIRSEKAKSRGSFERRIFLMDVEGH